MEMTNNMVHLNPTELALEQSYRLFLLIVLAVIAFALLKLAAAIKTNKVRERVDRQKTAERSVQLLLEIEKRSRVDSARREDKNQKTESEYDVVMDDQNKESVSQSVNFDGQGVKFSSNQNITN